MSESEEKAAAKLHIVVDWKLCVGHGQCEFAAPDVFTINDEGKLDLDETPDESQRAKVEQAIRRCPTRALSLGDPREPVPGATRAPGSKDG